MIGCITTEVDEILCRFQFPKYNYDQNRRWYSFCYGQSLKRSTACIRGDFNAEYRYYLENCILLLNTVKKEIYLVRLGNEQRLMPVSVWCICSNHPEIILAENFSNICVGAKFLSSRKLLYFLGKSLLLLEKYLWEFMYGIWPHLNFFPRSKILNEAKCHT